MSTSPIKRMLAEPVTSYKKSRASASLERDDWKINNTSRWRVSGTVLMPSGLAVEVWSGGATGDTASGQVSLIAVLNGRQYVQHLRNLYVTSHVSLRRLAAAFAKRVLAESKKARGAA